MRRKTYWKNIEHWVCPNHLPAVNLPSIYKECWYVSCESKRPKEKPKEMMFVITNQLRSKPYCQWFRCKSGVSGERGIITSRKKYCSNECRKRKARFNYSEKKRLENINKYSVV